MDNILLLNKANIISGKLSTLIPEFYDLKNVVENNAWHKKENVFDHTISVLRNLEKITSKLDKEAKQYLNIKIDNNSRKDLLRLAVLFHDISKFETIMYNKDLSTLCLDHESRGAVKTKKILKRFEITNIELKFILNIIKNHGLLHGILSLTNKNFEKEFLNFKERFFDNIYWELILLAFADTKGSYLTKTNQVEFKYRISFYEKEIKNMPHR